MPILSALAQAGPSLTSTLDSIFYQFFRNNEPGRADVLLCNFPKPIKEIRTKLLDLFEHHKW